MKIEKTVSTGSRRLILIFAGWGMDTLPFRHLTRPGYDIAIAYDYRDSCADWSQTDGYDEICLFAWSLGVAAASRHIPEEVCRRITRRVAINGTTVPVSDRSGIPQAVFRGTLSNLDERNLMKFRRRMCGSREVYEDFCRVLPQRTTEDLREELEAFLDSQYSVQPSFRWDAAVIGCRDAIFPPDNQRHAWTGISVFETDEPHLPDFRNILTRYAIDKENMAERFADGRKSYDSAADAQYFVVGEMMNLLGKSGLPDNSRVLEIGCGSGILSRLLAGRFSSLELWDIAGQSPLPDISFRKVDAEIALPLEVGDSLDAIFSASTVQWFNSPARFLAESARVLRHEGMLMFSTFLPGNLAEVERCTGRSLPLLSVEEWRKIIPQNLALCDVREYEFAMYFDTPIDVFRHLRATGVNSLDRNGNIFRSIGAYPIQEDGRCRLTYRPVIFLLRKL